MSLQSSPFVWFVALLLGWLTPDCVYAASRIALIYPKTSSNVRGVLDEVRDVLREEANRFDLILVEREIDPHAAANRASTQAWLNEIRAVAVLVVGRAAFDSVEGLEHGARIITGMVDIPVRENPKISGVALFPDPREMLETIRALAPSTQRVLVPYDPQRHDWLVEIAQKRANTIGLTLLPLRTADVRAASLHYANVFRYSNPKSDALWIIDSQFATDDATLPLVVEESWLTRFPVCSTAVQHLSRGVLCTAYVAPRQVALLMAQLAREAAQGSAPRIILPSDVSRGVNMKIASHLGIGLNTVERRKFQIVVDD